MLLLYLMSQKNPEMASAKRKRWQKYQLLGFTQPFMLDPRRDSPPHTAHSLTASQQDFLHFPSREHTQLWARPPAVCGKPQTQSKIPTWQKEAAGALKRGEGAGQGRERGFLRG